MAATSSLRGLLCRVTYSYEPVNEDELTLKVGDVIIIQKEIEQGWWEGLLNDKVGAFPSNFVKIIEDEEVEKDKKTSQSKQDTTPGACSSASDSEKESAIVEYPYKPIDSDELELTEGDVVTVLDKDAEKGWWRGRLKGKTGVLPSNFVSLLAKGRKSSATEEKKNVVSKKKQNKMKKKRSLSDPFKEIVSEEPQIQPVPRLVHVTRMRPKGPASRRPPTRKSLCPSSCDVLDSSVRVNTPETLPEENDTEEVKPKTQHVGGFRVLPQDLKGHQLRPVQARQSVADPSSLFIKKFVDQTTEPPPLKEEKENPSCPLIEQLKKVNSETPDASSKQENEKVKKGNEKKNRKEKPSVPSAPKPKIGVTSLFSNKNKQKATVSKPKLGISALPTKTVTEEKSEESNKTDDSVCSSSCESPVAVIIHSPKDNKDMNTMLISNGNLKRRKSLKKHPAPQPPIAALKENKIVEEQQNKIIQEQEKAKIAEEQFKSKSVEQKNKKTDVEEQSKTKSTEQNNKKNSVEEQNKHHSTEQQNRKNRVEEQSKTKSTKQSNNKNSVEEQSETKSFEQQHKKNSVEEQNKPKSTKKQNKEHSVAEHSKTKSVEQQNKKSSFEEQSIPKSVEEQNKKNNVEEKSTTNSVEKQEITNVEQKETKSPEKQQKSKSVKEEKKNNDVEEQKITKDVAKQATLSVDERKNPKSGKETKQSKDAEEKNNSKSPEEQKMKGKENSHEKSTTKAAQERKRMKSAVTQTANDAEELKNPKSVETGKKKDVEERKTEEIEKKPEAIANYSKDGLSSKSTENASENKIVSQSEAGNKDVEGLKQQLKDLKAQVEDQSKQHVEERRMLRNELDRMVKEVEDIRNKQMEVQSDIRGLKKMSD